jgi:hypothetical protein
MFERLSGAVMHHHPCMHSVYEAMSDSYYCCSEEVQQSQVHILEVVVFDFPGN